MLALTLRGATFREGRLLFGDEKNPRDVMPLSAGSGTRSALSDTRPGRGARAGLALSCLVRAPRHFSLFSRCIARTAECTSSPALAPWAG